MENGEVLEEDVGRIIPFDDDNDDEDGGGGFGFTFDDDPQFDEYEGTWWPLAPRIWIDIPDN